MSSYIYNQRGRRPSWLLSAHIRQVRGFLGETSSNRDIFFTEDARKKFFPTSKISAQEIRHQFFLIKLKHNGSYHGLKEPIRKIENHYPELKIY